MPQKKSGKNRSARSLGDVTLNDFANSSVCKNRLKKSTNNVNTVLKKFEEEKSWDEKTDEYEGDFVEEVDEEGNVSFVIRKVEPRRRKKTISSSEEVKDISGKEYPIDIWFILSEYIRPEDVGRFAGICKTSFEVACTAKFWYSLYRRYYTNVPNIPEQLQPECLVRKYSLRTSVIRALHYTYPPFVNKLKSMVSMEEHPDTLRRRQCHSLWQQKQKDQWVFYFKMRERRDNFLQHSRIGSVKQPDLLEMLDDVSANPDEHCRVLQVTCKHFIQIPPVIGQVLTSVCVTLSQGFRHHRLQLGFGSGISCGYSSTDGAGSTAIVLDPVINFRVLDWWHPLYPHSHNIQDLLNQD